MKFFKTTKPAAINILGIILPLIFFIAVGILSLFDALSGNANNKDDIQNNANHTMQTKVKSHSNKKLSAADLVETKEVNIEKKNNQPVVLNSKQMADFNEYMKNVERRIKLNWDPTTESQNKVIIVLFEISKDGDLLRSKVIKSSGIDSVDKSVIQAIQLTAPFPPLPQSFNRDSIIIEFTFDYHKVK